MCVSTSSTTNGCPKMCITDADVIFYQGGKSYNPWSAYGQSKTANILFSFYLGKKLRKRGIAVFAVNPGRKSTEPAASSLLESLLP